MCTSAWFPETQEHVTNMAGLAKRLGCEPRQMVFLDVYQPLDEWVNLPGAFESCTCPIDIEGTAAKFGYTAERDNEGDPMGYIVRKSNKS